MVESHSRRWGKVSVVSLSESKRASHTERGVSITRRVVLDNETEVELVPKDVNYETLACPDCEIALRYDEHEDAVCPECGYMGETSSEHEHKDYFGGNHREHGGDERGVQ